MILVFGIQRYDRYNYTYVMKMAQISIGLIVKYNFILNSKCFYCFHLALRNQSWNQATGKLMIRSVGFFTINEWQKFETIGGVEPSIEKAQILTDYIMSIHYRLLFCFWFLFNNYWF